ncbi:MAG: hypothetical protein B6D39_01615 [Anaerolineae bacterium UTCFX2]|jgi:uncharacterized protein (TIGR00297 family)|nr:DUF92 domain-containing protein [Anaerolineae bacterium]MCZ7552658.1 DUF92 domain-containing protein [Anaerolineales bacterium]OQY94202.1 MAG: hypothetical protein B6D39_01615 [Anaerolineae bacterium UTCFX2]
MQLFLGILLGIIVAALAWKAKALNRSGALAAALTGGLIFGIGGLPWAALLLAFFLSSSLLSRLAGRRKQTLSEKFSKGSQRDWGQVLANGGLGAVLAILHALLPGETWLWAAYAGAMAAVNADTWATELGVLNPQPPRLITTWQPMEYGASGAISLLGSLAAMSGAALVGLLAMIFGSSPDPAALFLAAVLGGTAGAFLDSLLGATLQAIYWCPVCEKETERHPVHLCGSPTHQIRGWSWLDNDWVNFIASLFGALICALIYMGLRIL